MHVTMILIQQKMMVLVHTLSLVLDCFGNCINDLDNDGSACEK